jgi:hypothetical protein
VATALEGADSVDDCVEGLGIPEMRDGMQEGWEVGGGRCGRWEVGDGRWEMGEMGDGRSEMGGAMRYDGAG